eukprot:3400968-Alexandrium_andersonii.AAC.1
MSQTPYTPEVAGVVLLAPAALVPAALVPSRAGARPTRASCTGARLHAPGCPGVGRTGVRPPGTGALCRL